MWLTTSPVASAGGRVYVTQSFSLSAAGRNRREVHRGLSPIGNFLSGGFVYFFDGGASHLAGLRLVTGVGAGAATRSIFAIVVDGLRRCAGLARGTTCRRGLR